MIEDGPRFDTLQLHAGQRPDPASGSRAVPIYQTSSYVFGSAEEARAVFAGEADGNQYARMHNPTTQAFADRLAALEGGVRAVAVASGQAATTATLMALARPGAEVLMSNQCFGGTFAVARKILEPWGCRVTPVEPTAEAVTAAAGESTVAVWLETIANPSNVVPDLPAVAAAAHAAGAPLIVDNTWGCGGYLCRPLEHGADAVVHSATKWIGGHGTFIGGAVVDGGSFDWDADGERFPAFAGRDARGRRYRDRDAAAPLAARVYDLALFTMGMTLAPHSAFLALQGLETLSLRVQRACDTALELARWLSTRPEVARVVYAGLPSHPSHDVARRVLRNGFGAVIGLELRSPKAAARLIDGVRVISHLANIGDAKSVLIHPATTTHGGLDADAREAAGAGPALVRLSVGLEDPRDLRADLERALDAVAELAPA